MSEVVADAILRLCQRLQFDEMWWLSSFEVVCSEPLDRQHTAEISVYIESAVVLCCLPSISSHVNTFVFCGLAIPCGEPYPQLIPNEWVHRRM